MYILIHIRLCGRVSDKNVFTRPIFESKTYLDFFGLTFWDIAYSGHIFISWVIPFKIGAANPTNNKRGGVCIYYHNLLSLKVIDIQLLNECINFEIRVGGKLCSFLCLYRSPSQTRDIFETFADNFELTLDSIINKNPFLIFLFGDFNGKTTNWYKNDINSYEGLKTDTITSQFGLQQIINEPTYLTSNPSSCIDLIFTFQPNLKMRIWYSFFPTP